MREGRKGSSLVLEEVAGVGERHQIFLLALAKHSHHLLSDVDLNQFLPQLLGDLLAPGVEAAALLDFCGEEVEGPPWRLRRLGYRKPEVGHEDGEWSSPDVVAAASTIDPRLFRQVEAPLARLSECDDRVALAPVFNDGALHALLWLRAEEGAGRWNQADFAALESLAGCLSRAVENRANAVALRQRLAQQGAIAHENARLYEQVRQRMNELELVHQVAVTTARLVDIDQLLQETTNFIAERIYPDVFGFVLRDEACGAYRPHPSYHGIPEDGFDTTVPAGCSVTGHVAMSGQPLIINDVTQDARYFSIVPETMSEIAVPMVSEGEVIGVINVESRKRDAFSEADLRFLMTLAGQVATALERVRLYEDLERHAEKLAHEVERQTMELKQERDRMLAIVESAGEGIMFTDVHANILYVNPALEWQTGYSRADCLGAKPNLWRSEETDGVIFEEMWETLLSGKRWRGELINRRKDGTTFDAALTITPLIDNEGNLSGFVGVQADISRLKEVERLKSKFIANVSHELRTPLTNIRNYTSLLERGSQQRRHKYVAVIKHESERLTRLIQDLLDLSRLDAKVRPAEMEQIDVGAFVRDTTLTFAVQAQRKQIALDVCVQQPLPRLLATRSELQQVLGNLLGNALAYTPVGGHVLVSAGSAMKGERKRVWIRVEDSGPGISHAERSRLFERFYRGEAARQSGAPGTGLGLAICKEILDNYSAELALESAPGEGATFTVWLPVHGESAD